MKKTILSLRSLFGLMIMGVCAIVLLTGCGVSNNFTFSSQTGACPKGPNNAPYCISITMNNNGGAQNWINSTTFPISNLVVNVSGATNIQTPSNNASTMDPNGCTTKTLNPGSSCTFYLKISNEAYPTTATENININMTYTINNSLFGSGSTYSNSFTIYQVTNLYIMQNSGNLIIANAAQINTFQAESLDTSNSTAVDTNSYGYLYIGGNDGIYQYGNESTSTSIASTAPQNAGNLFTLGANLYAAGIGSSPTVGIYSLANRSWESTSYTSTVPFMLNVNSVAVDGSEFYLATSNQVLSCPIGGTNPTCKEEGVNLSNVQTIAATNVDVQPFTGLYTGTSNGLFAESGAFGTKTAQWIPVKTNIGNNIESTVSSTVTNGNLYAGDISGNIWFISSSSTTPLVANQFLNGALVNSGSITNMVVDNVAALLYFIVKSGTTYTLYACSIATPATCTNLQKAPSTFPTITNPVVGLNIGSQLVSSLSSQPN